MKTKKCKICSKIKPRTEFYSYKSTNQYNKTYTCYMQPCKTCKKAQLKENYNSENIPFNKMREKIVNIYNDKKEIITYDESVAYEEKKKKRKTRRKKK